MPFNNIVNASDNQTNMKEKESEVQAIILAGGFGTRLRPLTFSCLKPLIPFCDLPILEHQVAALVKAKVSKIVLAVSFKPQGMDSFIEHCKGKYKVDIVFSIEETPLGTAGPIALAQSYITSHNFFVLNSDVISLYPFDKLLEFHLSHGSEGTLVVTEVSDPSRFGVIISDSTFKIKQFVEKPKKWVGNHINAGMYCFNKSIFNRIKPVKTSIELEIFPKMAEANELYTFPLKGYQMDIGKPVDYLKGTLIHLASIAAGDSSINKEEWEFDFDNRVLKHVTSKIGKKCHIGPDVVISKNCVIEDNLSTNIKQTVLFENVHIKEGACLTDSIVGWDSTIGKNSKLERLCVLERDVNVEENLKLIGAVICSHKTIKEDVLEPKIIL